MKKILKTKARMRNDENHSSVAMFLFEYHNRF